jgi:hypothetical protein
MVLSRTDASLCQRRADAAHAAGRARWRWWDDAAFPLHLAPRDPPVSLLMKVGVAIEPAGRTEAPSSPLLGAVSRQGIDGESKAGTEGQRGRTKDGAAAAGQGGRGMETQQLRQETDDDRQMFVYLDDDGWFESSALASAPHRPNASKEVQDPSARSSGETNDLGWSDLASTDALPSRPHNRIVSYEVTEDGVARQSGMELLPHRLGTDLAQHKATSVGERARRPAGTVLTLLAHQADCDECLTVECLTVVGSSRHTGARTVTVAPDHPWRSPMSAGDWSRRRKQHVELVSEQMLMLNKRLNGIENWEGGSTMHQMRLNIPRPTPLVDGTGSERENERASRHAEDASGEAKSDTCVKSETTDIPLRSVGAGQPKIILDDRATERIERIEAAETRALQEHVRRLQQRLAAVMHQQSGFLSENRALQEQLTKHQYPDHHPRTKTTFTTQDAEIEEILMELTSLRRGRLLSTASAGDVFEKGTASSLSLKLQAGRRGSAGDVVSAQKPNAVESITPSSPLGAIAVSAGTPRGACSSLPSESLKTPKKSPPPPPRTPRGARSSLPRSAQRATGKQEEEQGGGHHRVSSLPNFPSSPCAQKLREEYEEDLTTLNRIRNNVFKPKTVHFVPALTFSGVLPGYVFKMGAQGRGYYSDFMQQQPAAAGEKAAPPKTPRASYKLYQRAGGFGIIFESPD